MKKNVSVRQIKGWKGFFFTVVRNMLQLFLFFNVVFMEDEKQGVLR